MNKPPDHQQQQQQTQQLAAQKPLQQQQRQQQLMDEQNMGSNSLVSKVPYSQDHNNTNAMPQQQQNMQVPSQAMYPSHSAPNACIIHAPSTAVTNGTSSTNLARNPTHNASQP